MARNENGKGFSLKDHLFNKEKVVYLGGLFAQVDSNFNTKVFQREVMKELPHLELKQRIVCIAKALESQLPKDFKKATKIIIQALPEPLSPDKTDNDFGDFIFAPLGEYIVRNGLSKKHLHLSLTALQEITQRFSMEDAIRYFLNAYEHETVQELVRWTKHPNYHVRRLVSEGTRPLLPWSGRIAMKAEDALPLLDALYADSTRFVTRSVANHMNDIAKQNPKLVVATLRRWKKEGKQDSSELNWMISHSLRTLVKQGNSEALALLGYHHTPEITVTKFAVAPSSKEISPGEVLEFSFVIKARKDEKLMVDYAIDFVKANGKTAPKVFKIKKLSVQEGQQYTIVKRHRFVKDATTLTFYPGRHTVTLQINGKLFDSQSFTIL